MSIISFPKRKYVRSKVLMEAYRKIPCQHCGADDGTVVGAHSNEAAHGKGRGIKADDSACSSLCHACHMQLDQGASLSRLERQAMWHWAHVKTVRELVGRGLWPVAIQIPDTSSHPLDASEAA